MANGVSAAVVSFVCPQCQKDCVTKRGLGQHRRFCGKAPAVASGVKSKAKRPGRLGQKTSLAEQIRIVFDVIVHDMHERTKVVEECVNGLTRVLDEADKLRMGYMQKVKEIGLLRNRVAELEKGE